jgi:hypothetical protein
VYVCVCAESIHVVKQFYLGPRCVCVCGPTTRMVRPQSYRSSSRAAVAASVAVGVGVGYGVVAFFVLLLLLSLLLHLRMPSTSCR